MTSNSLIVIDELCRTTNSEEGLKIAWKISDKIIQIKGIDQYHDNTVNFYNLSSFFYFY